MIGRSIECVGILWITYIQHFADNIYYDLTGDSQCEPTDFVFEQ